ncbi:uncharacterized protein P884DRAFT_305166 [Thermothelomyces heterothallicus CBS 202.75]|uniref:uncharacterized protein n=1 Tax=Thermothelomyces heterothallicus CBS 202.75 TaxID=1149848 RepID=UPI0037442D2D
MRGNTTKESAREPERKAKEDTTELPCSVLCGQQNPYALATVHCGVKRTYKGMQRVKYETLPHHHTVRLCEILLPQPKIIDPANSGSGLPQYASPTVIQRTHNGPGWHGLVAGFYPPRVLGCTEAGVFSDATMLNDCPSPSTVLPPVSPLENRSAQQETFGTMGNAGEGGAVDPPQYNPEIEEEDSDLVY